MRDVYTTGYTGRLPEQIKAAVERLGARLIDIRHNNQPVILLCACKDLNQCHRKLVGETLRTRGYNVQEDVSAN